MLTLKLTCFDKLEFRYKTWLTSSLVAVAVAAFNLGDAGIN